MLVKVCGTVSPYCHDTKNCPGFLIEEKNTKILLDCGNGITRELVMEKDLSNLTVIISHLHKDHYGDLLSLAYASFVHHNLGLLDKKIKVYLPEPNYQQEEITYPGPDGEVLIRQIEPTINDYNFLANLGVEQFLEFSVYNQNTVLNIGNLNINFAKNPHQVNTYSAKITSDYASLVYGTDTGYQGNILEKFAQNTDLLICESTFLKGQVKKTDNHLYAYEAGLIAKQAQPQKLLLTHFYPTIPKIEYLKEAKEIFSNTEVAEEGKIFRLERRNNND